MPRQKMPMSDVLLWLHTHHPELESEVDRDWVWITSDIGPLHRKCQCAECEGRKAIRESLKEIGFAFAFSPHPLPSGNTSRWSHSCNHPTRFKRRGEKAGGESTATQEVSDEQLLQMIGG